MPQLESFGFPPLDKILGGIPTGTLLLLENDPGVEAEPFLYQFAYQHLRQGIPVVYCVANRAPSSVRQAFKEFGFDDADALARLHFVDAYSGLLGGSEGASFTVRDPRDPEAVASMLERAAREHPEAVFVVDPLSTFIDHATFPVFARVLPRLQGVLKRFRLGVVLFTRWPYEEDVAPLVQAFDGVIAMHAVEERVVVSQYFAVERAPWKDSVDHRPLLYKTKRPGGVYVYLPKILITGPHHAGKSTFIHSISDTASSTEYRGTTVGIDHGHLTYEGLTVDLFGTPGQERFDPLLKILAEEAVGVILLVDSTRPDSLPRAKQMLLKVWRHGLPAIVAANKQDLPGALTTQEIAEILTPPERVAVVGCISQDKASGILVLKRLIDQILHGPQHGAGEVTA